MPMLWKSVQTAPQVPDQHYCSDPTWQKARKRTWQKERRRKDPDYRENQRATQKRWVACHPDYWRQWREAHPAYQEQRMDYTFC